MRPRILEITLAKNVIFARFITTSTDKIYCPAVIVIMHIIEIKSERKRRFS